MAATVVTTKAKNKMLKARAGLAALPKIKGMAFGTGGVDGGGEPISPTPDMNKLRKEVLRKDIKGVEQVSDTLFRYSCELSEDELAGEYISELALYDADGDLVAIKSFTKKGKDADMKATFEAEDTF